MKSRDSSVGAVTEYGLDVQGSIPGTASRPALGHIQPPIQWIPNAPFRGVKRMGGGETDHLLPSIAGVKNGASVLPLTQHVFMA
jgi:hypothetical protein